jgi:FAD/FMN-containing dehydrogenase/Fe-S oxidoreductase
MVGLDHGAQSQRNRRCEAMTSLAGVDADKSRRAARRALASRLGREIRGEVRFDDGARALYATDASNYRQVPIGVVLPRDADDVVATVAACRAYEAPVLVRGGGTSLAGQCCNVAVVIDMSRHMNRVLEIDTGRRLARVEPGVVLDRLRQEARVHGLTFGPDPATHDHCTLGGMLGNNSCGVHSVMAQFRGGGARTADNTHELEVLAYDGTRLRVGPTAARELESIVRAGGRRGEIYSRLAKLRDGHAEEIRKRFPDIPRRVSGYNLDELLPERGFHVARSLVGSESTCVTILEATVQLLEEPPARALLVLGYPDVCDAGDHVTDLLEHRPIGLEAIDDKLVGYMRRRGMHADDLALLPPGNGWLLVEMGAPTREEAVAAARSVAEALGRRPDPPSIRLFESSTEAEKIWAVRESALGATAFVQGLPDTWPGWEDSAVPPARVGAYLRELRKLFRRYDYEASLYGHLGQGCVHCRIPFDLTTASGIDAYRRFTEEAAELVLRLGGSLSGEHGDGQARGDLLERMYGQRLCDAFAEFKSIWDPDWKMNPGKVVRPAPRTSNLRLAPDPRPPQPATHFAFPADDRSFSRATLRCVGVGKCRRESGGIMCPSYMATREEQHSTRGRARLLFEMQRGEVIRGGWRNEDVREALDLCLGCKGCKGECPVNVDIAAYKAEFYAHHYARGLRPRHMYLLGRIYEWARLATTLPGAANAMLERPWLAALARRAGEIAPQRPLPRFAEQTFRDWFRRRGPVRGGGERVVLWPDTFCNHFHPHVARAATRVLEAAGFDVTIPRRPLCCGRPLYDCGWIEVGRRRLRRVVDELRADLRAGVPVVVLEPSCCSVFRDELAQLLPDDEDAARLRQQAVLLSELLMRRRPGLLRGALDGRRAIVQLHCHHRAVLGSRDEQALFEATGLQCEIPEPGCCGLSGPFGFRRGRPYEISERLGERQLLPAVRAADGDTLVIANGYSCREQIAHLGDRRAVHLAEALAGNLEAWRT